MIVTALAALPTALFLQQGQAPVRPDFRDQPAVVERIHQRIRFENDGTGTRELSMRVRVQSEAGVQQFGQLNWPYSSASETLRIDTVVVHSASGIVRADDRAVQDVSGPIATEAPMYTDLRQKIVTVPALRPGDTLEVHVVWTTGTPVAPGEFWYQTDFVRDGIVLDERIELDIPADRAVTVKSAPGTLPAITETGGRKRYRWQRHNYTLLTDSSAAELQRHPPPPSVQVTTFRSWDQVGAWYTALTRDRDIPNDVMRREAARLVADRKTLRDSVAAIYGFVAKGFRYVSLSFGIGRFQPHAAAEVFANKYGDCKDKHTLFAALLRAVNLNADPVLISSGRDIDPEVPSPAQFDHLISAMTGLGPDVFWLDTTPGLAPFGYLIPDVRNKHALVMRASASTMLKTPAALAEPQRLVTEIVGQLNALGTLKASVSQVMRGDGELFLRMGFQAVPRNRWNELGQGVATAFELSGDITDVAAGSPETTEQPFRVTFQLSQTGFATWTKNRSEINLPMPLGELADSVTRDSSAIRVQGVREATARLRLALPPGSARLPVAVSLTRPYGTYRASYVRRGDSLIAERVLAYSGSAVVAADPNDYAAFLRAIRNDQEQQVVLERAAGVTADDVGDASVAELLASARAAFNNRDLLTALDLFRKVVKAAPRHADAWNDFGRAFNLAGMFDSGAVALRKQVAINPYHQYAWNNLGLALRGLRKYAEAEQAFLKALEINPLDEWAHANLGGMFLGQHKDSAAAVHLAEATAVRTEDGQLWINLGEAYLRLHRPDSAKIAFDKAIDIAPGPTASNNIAYAYANAGVNLEDAERLARQAVDASAGALRSVSLDRLTPRDWSAARSIASYWDTLGWILFRENKLEEAEAYITASWQLAQHGEVGDHLGQILMATGRKEAGIKLLAQATTGRGAQDETRKRLEEAAKGRNIDQLIARGREDAAASRTILVKVATRDVIGRANLLFSKTGALEDIRFSGATVPASVTAALKAAKYPVTIPGTEPLLLPRQAAVVCDSKKADCQVTLIEVDNVDPRP